MTTGQDETGRRAGEPNLLASLPGDRAAAGIGPAAFEELRAAVLEMREELAGLRKDAQAERPEPVTRDALDAWGEDLLKRFCESIPKGAGADESAAAIADHAGRVAEAAGGIERGLERTADRFSAEIKGDGGMACRGPFDHPRGHERDRERHGAHRGRARRVPQTGRQPFRNDIASVVFDTRDRVRKLNFEWRIFLAPWAVGMFVAGMVFATAMKLANRLL